MKTFLSPLSTEEEAKLLRQMADGDLTAKSSLIEHNMRLVAHVAKKYYGSGEDPEDLVSIGTIGLLKAVDTYDGTKGYKLVTYAARCIDNELLMYFRGRKKQAKDVSLFEPIGSDKEGNQISLYDVLEQEPMDIAAESLAKHAEWRGKLAFDPKMDIATRHDLAVAYTPGVAEPCKVIAENPEAAYDYTLKANTVAVVSDGSAVLGLGNIGPAAAMPVMEG